MHLIWASASYDPLKSNKHAASGEVVPIPTLVPLSNIDEFPTVVAFVNLAT